MPCGLQVHNADLREDGKPSHPVAMPEVKDDLYTDHEFTLNDALGKLAAGLDWKRPQVRIILIFEVFIKSLLKRDVKTVGSLL